MRDFAAVVVAGVAGVLLALPVGAYIERSKLDAPVKTFEPCRNPGHERIHYAAKAAQES